MTDPIFTIKYPSFDPMGNKSVQWEVSPSFTGLPPWQFSLQGAETEQFDTLAVEVLVGDKQYAVDSSKAVNYTHRDLWYRIQLKTAEGKKVYSKPFKHLPNIPREKYLLISEIIRKEFLRMNRVGTAGWLLRPRYVGTRAEHLDPLTGVPLTDEVNSYGIGIVGGYYPAVPRVFSVESKNQVNKMDENGRGQNATMVAKLRTCGFPICGERDVIVDAEGNRWFISTTSSTMFPGTSAVLSQMLDVSLIDPTDSVYQIEVKP
jgi:hypothetical protein